MPAPSLLIFALLAAQTETATSAAPRIDLISMGVGGALYAVFGHAAIRVVHPDGRDMAYNFGGVDINVPNFWVTLMRGKIQAYLEVTPYSQLLLKYSGEDRTIIGRTLNFTPDQARKIVAELDAIAADPARKNYYYHHVLDNCTTRIAKLFDEQLNGVLSAQSKTPVRGTHRDWIIETIRDKPGLYLLMDLTGNGMGDVPLERWQTTFLPVGLDAVIDGAKLDGRPLVKSKYLDYRSISFSDRDQIDWDWPWTKVYILFVLPLIALAFWRPRITSFVFGLAAGGMGLFYVVLWIGSDYEFLHRNWNMINFPPTHLALAFVALRRSWWDQFAARRRAYLVICCAALSALAIADVAGLIAQAIGPMLAVSLPIMLSLLLSARLLPQR
jgi:hypothetical protein